MDKKRCDWVTQDPLYVSYHDQEWGVPVYDDRTLFEFLCLEGMQAGLSWITVLRKREAFREAFLNFEAEKIVHFSEAKVQDLMQNIAIIRNKRKIESVISNAKVFLEIKQQSSFSDFIWAFVGGEPQHNHWKTGAEIPANTEVSDCMAKALKQRGFKFVGTTICYAFMQATGMVNDHVMGCYRYHEAC